MDAASGTKLVLIVEDEYGHSEVLRLLLQQHGFRVAAASNGQAALELLAGEKPAVILSDFMMPQLNGAELGLAVRGNPALCDIPIVFMSATNEEVVARSFADYDAFLGKPYDVQALLDLLDRLAAEGRARPARRSEVDASMKQLLEGIDIPPRE